MKSVVIAAGAAALLALAVSGAAAQSLGDVAAQEAERRKNIKSSGKVYTNGSVRSDAAGSAAPAPASPAPGATAPASPAPAATAPAPGASGQPGPATVGETRTEAYWKKRVAATREALSRAQTFAEALQTRINVLSADFVNRDDPAQRNTVAADRQKALAELERVKQEIQQHQKALTDIQDEARRANVPAGWAR